MSSIDQNVQCYIGSGDENIKKEKPKPLHFEFNLSLEHVFYSALSACNQEASVCSKMFRNLSYISKNIIIYLETNMNYFARAES